ncbi:hypothetical protein VTO42DRAFT_5777 [Malbranchea cinnamomea]
MPLREKIKRVFARSPDASREDKMTVATAPDKPPGNRTRPLKSTAGTNPTPKTTPKPRAAAAAPYVPPAPNAQASAVRARFAGVSPRKPKYGKDGKPKIELYKPHEVPPSKYRGPVDPNHLKKLEDYSWARATANRERPRSVVSQLSPTETGLLTFWAGLDDDGVTMAGQDQGPEGNAESQDGKMQSAIQPLTDISVQSSAPQETNSRKENDVSPAARDHSSELTALTHDGTDAVSAQTLLTSYTEEEPSSSLNLTESHALVFDPPAKPLSSETTPSSKPDTANQTLGDVDRRQETDTP